MKEAGVYKIECLPTGEVYVGGSVDLDRRFRQHLHLLRKKKHKSAALQTAWDRHTEEKFQFHRMLVCRPEDVRLYEQRALDHYQPVFNTEKIAGSSQGTKRTFEQRERLKLRPQSTAALHLVYGQLISVPEMAKKYHLRLTTIYERLREGVVGDELVAPVHDGSQNVHFVQGEWLTPKEIASKAGLPLTTIYTRLKAGWKDEQLLIPQVHRGRNSQ